MLGRRRDSTIASEALPRVKSLTETLEEAQRLYDYQLALIEGHLELYRRLDMACAGIERFRQLSYQPKASPRVSAFDLDLVNVEFAEKFYASGEYSTRSSDVSSFITGEHARKFVNTFFSYPEDDPAASLLAYCKPRLSFVAKYGVEKMLQLKALLNEKRRLSVSEPFWRPQIWGAAEKLRIISVGDACRPEVGNVLDGMNTATRTVIVNTNGVPKSNDSCLTIIQVSYGRPIESIFEISIGTQ